MSGSIVTKLLRFSGYVFNTNSANITPNNVALTFVLSDGFVPVSWRALAKDGADLSAAQQTTREARQLVSVGETYDFAVTPTPRQRLWLNLVRGNGEWDAQRLLVAAP